MSRRSLRGSLRSPDPIRAARDDFFTTSQRVRDQLGIRPGGRLQVLTFDNRIELLPVESPQELRGFLAGIDTTVVREPDRV